MDEEEDDEFDDGEDLAQLAYELAQSVRRRLLAEGWEAPEDGVFRLFCRDTWSYLCRMLRQARQGEE